MGKISIGRGTLIAGETEDDVDLTIRLINGEEMPIAPEFWCEPQKIVPIRLGTMLRNLHALHRILDHGKTVLVTGEGAGSVLAEALKSRGLIRNPHDPSLSIYDLTPCPETAIFACLMGGAIGDALGWPIEFKGLDDLPAPDSLLYEGLITDDTQMTLFVGEGLITGGPDFITSVHEAMVRWGVTQGHGHVPDPPIGLLRDPRLFHQRAPGLTNLTALAHVTLLGSRADNDSKGCGGIMRSAPFALIPDLHEARRLSAACTALTHGHPTAPIVSGAWAGILWEVLRDVPLDLAVQSALDYVEREGCQETEEAIRAALGAPKGLSPEQIARLGGGWTADTALSIALYACLHAQTPEEGWITAALHAGDSDSTAAIAGNLLGILFPEEVLSHRWAHDTECTDLIQDIAKRLVAAF